MRTVITRSFTALKSLGEGNLTDLGYLLDAMQSEREVALKHDLKTETDPHREFIYFLNESIENALRCIIERTQTIEQKTEKVPRKESIQQEQIKEASPSIPSLNVTDNGISSAISESEIRKEKDVVRDSNGSNNEEKTDSVTRRGIRETSALRTLKCPVHKCETNAMSLESFVKHLTEEHTTTPAKARIAFGCACGYVGTSPNDARMHRYRCRCCVLTVIERTTCHGLRF
ncbi:hypothetical protein PENTCL1PPCAC_7360 [Pristionchus entomophagus]|uniref:C2H2-type domain-containing protein n=1 Tax=Pristionchus entomophagus TaxID=358040 RepID=A0AAV5SYN4_9BILA|nr:hypothetical protein PENTCL1PPCAC_7360 [Pristionchus entomophagus]